MSGKPARKLRSVPRRTEWRRNRLRAARQSSYRAYQALASTPAWRWLTSPRWLRRAGLDTAALILRCPARAWKGWRAGPHRDYGLTTIPVVISEVVADTGIRHCRGLFGSGPIGSSMEVDIQCGSRGLALLSCRCAHAHDDAPVNPVERSCAWYVRASARACSWGRRWQRERRGGIRESSHQPSFMGDHPHISPRPPGVAQTLKGVSLRDRQRT